MIELRSPFSRAADVEVFAADATTAQLSVRRRQGEFHVSVDGRQLPVPSMTGAAVVDIAGLEPDTAHEAAIIDATGSHRLPVRTKPDIGRVVARIATISDVHLGLEGFGLIREIRDKRPDPYPLRTAMAAVAEAEAWGADLLCIKGDLCETGTLEEWDQARRLIEATTIPVIAIPGNHEVRDKRELSAADGFAHAGVAHEPVQVLDLPGVRLVAGDTSIDGKGRGTLAAGDMILDAVNSSDRPCLVAIHHNIERFVVPWFWPPGIARHRSRAFVAGLAAAQAPVFLTSGHTHRHHSHHLGPPGALRYTEVGATSDYPGVWAAYEVGEKAIRQTVRRIRRPSVVEWTESTRRAVGGLWDNWSQGRFDDRCVDLVLA